MKCIIIVILSPVLTHTHSNQKPGAAITSVTWFLLQLFELCGVKYKNALKWCRILTITCLPDLEIMLFGNHLQFHPRLSTHAKYFLRSWRDWPNERISPRLAEIFSENEISPRFPRSCQDASSSR